MFEFEGIQGHQHRYITWLLEQCAPDVAPPDILAPDALELLADRSQPATEETVHGTAILANMYRQSPLQAVIPSVGSGR